jgi:hypothetical protein
MKYDAMTGAIANVDIRGAGGVELERNWADGLKGLLHCTEVRRGTQMPARIQGRNQVPAGAAGISAA